MTPTPDPIAAIERESENDIRRAAVNLVDTFVLERETNGQSKEFMDWAVFMTVRAFEEQCASLARQAAEKDAEIARLREALRPFSDEAGCYDPDTGDSDDVVWAVPAYFKIRDLRRARSLTTEISDAQG